jgi:surface antigen
MRMIIMACAASLALAGCVEQGGGNPEGVPAGYPSAAPPGQIGLNKTTGGALIGAGVGGLAGSQMGKGSGKIALTALGVLTGGLLGSQIGRSLDQADLMYAQQKQQSALESAPSGQNVGWVNPDTGHSGEIIPQPATNEYGQVCREFQQRITVGGQTQQGWGKACRQSDGSWRLVQN